MLQLTNEQEQRRAHLILAGVSPADATARVLAQPAGRAADQVVDPNKAVTTDEQRQAAQDRLQRMGVDDETAKKLARTQAPHANVHEPGKGAFDVDEFGKQDTPQKAEAYARKVIADAEKRKQASDDSRFLASLNDQSYAKFIESGDSKSEQRWEKLDAEGFEAAKREYFRPQNIRARAKARVQQIVNGGR